MSSAGAASSAVAGAASSAVAGAPSPSVAGEVVSSAAAAAPSSYAETVTARRAMSAKACLNIFMFFFFNYDYLADLILLI